MGGATDNLDCLQLMHLSDKDEDVVSPIHPSPEMSIKSTADTEAYAQAIYINILSEYDLCNSW